MALEDEFNSSIFIEEAFRVLNENVLNFPDFFLNYVELANLELLNHNYIKSFWLLKNTHKMATSPNDYDEKEY